MITFSTTAIHTMLETFLSEQNTFFLNQSVADLTVSGPDAIVFSLSKTVLSPYLVASCSLSWDESRLRLDLVLM